MYANNIEPMKDEEFRDIYYNNSRYANQTKQLKKDTNKVNFRDWLIYEEWLITQGIKKITIIKRLFCYKSIMQLYPTNNLKAINQQEIINVAYNIMMSDYSEYTKKEIQITLRQYLLLFSNTTKRDTYIKKNIKLISTSAKAPTTLITHEDFINIKQNMPHKNMCIMVMILYATGMRITELYNIKPSSFEHYDEGLFINTKGKRTRGNKHGNYRYFLIFFVKEILQYIKQFKPDEYIFNYSSTYFSQCLKKALKKSNLDYKIYPHLFRHTVATELFKNYATQTVYKCMNWSPNSRMANVYSNLYDKDIADTMENLKKRQKNLYTLKQ